VLDQGQPKPQKGAKHQGREVRPTLQASWLAHPDEGAHEQARVDAGDVDQEALEDVVVVPQVSPAHPTSFERVGKGQLEQLSASSQELLAALCSNTPTVGVDSLALRFLVDAGRDTRSSHLPRVEALTAVLDEAVEPALLQHTVERLVERMPARG